MRRILVAATALALLLTPVVTPAHAEPSPIPPPAPAPKPTRLPAAERPEKPQTVMVLLKEQPDAPDPAQAGIAAAERVIERWKDTEGFKVRRKFGYLVGGFSATLPGHQVHALRNDPDVARVQPVRTYKPSMQTAAEMTQSIAARTNLDVDGAGTVISIIDSGIDPGHQDMRLDDGVATKLSPQGEHATLKVPYGWNYADENSNFIDTTASMHGMHVAGIVAANGGPDADALTNGRINGIAPNAQLLAMKVFSNDPALSGGAMDDDIIAAVEDSVKLGADVINLSLGTANGTNDASVGLGRAVALAQEAGVQVVVAAGNEALNGSLTGDDVDHTTMLDDGTLGSPATAPGALAVASVDNSHLIASVATVASGTDTLRLPYLLLHGEPDDQPHGIVHAGLGRPEDFPANTAGNYVLLQRGELTFEDKFSNAVEAGAAGVIIHNHAEGGDNFVRVAGVRTVPDMIVSMFRSTGEQLRQAIEAGGGITQITLTTEKVRLARSATPVPSVFTSWGATPGLDFKPQLSGIGGNVYSTLNNNTYREDSGTSMAAPHVAGAFALGVARYRQTYPDLSPAERNQQLRTAFSNTAKILEHTPNQPYAPRQIGAGLIQTENALTTKVFATVEGHPTIALRQINGPRTFTVTLTNHDDHDHHFTTGATCVITETQKAGQANTTSCNNTEKLTPTTSNITVPAGGTATVDYTLTPNLSDRHWTQGWATLDSTEDTQPDLAIPYLGFVGDWNAEPIIDHPNTSDQPSVLNDLFGQAHPHQTLLAGFLGSGVQETPWFSPNGDGLLDELFPLYMMLRSAHEMEFEILKGDTVVRTLGTRRDQLRFTLADVADTPFSAAHGSVDHFWDGTLHNPNTGAFEPVPDAGIGTYTFRIKARLSEDFDWQITDLPIGIDTVAPSVSHTVATQPDGSRVYTILATDADSGIAGPRSVIAHDSASPSYFEVTEPTPNSYTFTVPAEMAESDNYVTIFVLDNAGNLVELRDFYQARPIRVLNSHRFDRWIGNSSAPTWIPEVIDGNAVVDLLLSPEVARVEWAGQPVAITDGKARVLIPVKPGRTDFELVAFAADGRELGRASHWLGYDENPPTLEITSAPLNDRGELVPGPDNTVTISGRVSDDLSTPDDLSVFDDLEEVPLDSEGRFTHTFSLNGETLELAALDHANQQREKDNWANTTVKTFLIEGRSDPHLTYIEFDEPNMNTDDPFGPGLVVVHPKFQNLEVVNPDAGPGELAARLRLTGKLVEQLTSFQVAGQEVELDADQRFSILIDLVGGINHVGYVAVDRDGKRIEGSWRFIYDRSLPGLDLKVDPRIHPDGAIYLTKQPTDVTFSGEVWDNEFGYRLSLNGNMVKEFQTPWDPGDHNRRPFTSTVPGMRDGQTISLQLQDRLGNGVERQIPVVLDDIDPTVSIDGPSGLVTRDAEFKVTAGDENLEKVSVLLDGKPVALEVVAAGTRPGAKYTERRQGEVVATSPEGSPSATTAQLTLRLKDLPDLASGRHTLSAVALDKAGNQNVTTRLLRVDEPPAITGPDSLVVEAGKDPRVAIREAYQATDPEDGAVELIFDATRLVPGSATELELSATDSAGNTTRRTVTITLKVGLPDTQVPPGAPGGGEPQQPTKPVPPARRPGLPKTGG